MASIRATGDIEVNNRFRERAKDAGFEDLFVEVQLGNVDPEEAKEELDEEQYDILKRYLEFCERTAPDKNTENGLSPDDERVEELIATINEGNRTERIEAKEELFDGISDWPKRQQNEVLKELDGNQAQIRGELNEYLENSDSGTEQTELLSKLNGGTPQESGRGDPVDSDLDRLIDIDAPPKKRLSGVVDGTFFLTIWIEDGGRTKPAVIDSNGNFQYIKNKLNETLRALSEDERNSLSEEQRDRLDYQYIEIDDQEVRFQHGIPEKPKSSINRPNNQVLQYVKNPDELPAKEKLYDRVRAFIQSCWDHYDDSWFDVVTAHVFHSYLVMPIAYTIYLLFKGKEATGKTTIQKALSLLQYNGVFGGNVTPATAQRYAHNYQVALNQDEFEKQSEERKTDLQGLYNTGQRKGGVYPITNTDKGSLAEQIQEIHTFSTKTLSCNSLYGWDESFLGRNVIINTVRTGRKGLKNPDKLSDADEQRLQQLRNQLAAYCVFNWEDIMADMEQVRNELQQKAREEDRITLFKGLVQHFKGADRAKQVENQLFESETLEGTQEINERHRIVLEEIVERFIRTESQQVTVQYKEIANIINKELNLQSSEYEATSRSVGKILQEYDLIRDSSQKGNDSQGYTVCDLPLKLVIDSLTRYDLAGLRDRLLHATEDEEGSKLDSVDTPSPSNSSTDPRSVSSVTQSTQSDTDYDIDLRHQDGRLREVVRREIEELDDGDGVDYTESGELDDRVGPREKLHAAIDDLLAEGDVFEPKPGRIKVL